MFVLNMVIASGDFVGVKIRDWIMLAGGAADWHKSKLQVILGRDLNDGDEVTEMDLVGRQCVAWIRHDKWEGRDGAEKIGLKIDAEGGECGYEAINEQTPPPASGAELADNDFSDIPFMFLIATTLFSLVA